MKVLFISSSCSREKYREVYTMRNQKLIDPQQKFCNLLIEGMSSAEGVEIECLSALPVSASTVSQKRFEDEVEIISQNLRYHYLPFSNGKISRYLSLFKNCRSEVKIWIEKNASDNKVIICDALSYFITRPAQIVAKKNGVKIIGIITDLPLLSTNMKGRKESIVKKLGLSVFQHLTDSSLKEYDAYIPLTESINEYANPNNKPYLIVEGSVESSEIYIKSETRRKKVMLYAGGIYEKYGLKKLVEAFIKADTNGYELHIYGEGSYVPELLEMSKKYPRVKYKGMVSLDEIVFKEREASVLVNPRPSDERFSKYSFPSKTMEYMVSKTPLLTTILPGIPKDYLQHVFSIHDESVNGMAESIRIICNMEQCELQKKGRDAFEFVMNKKSNVVQGKQIISFAKSLIPILILCKKEKETR